MKRKRHFNVQVNTEQTGNKGISLCLLLTCKYKASFFVTGGPCNQEKSLIFIEVCKCRMLFVNFYSVTVFNSAVMEFWLLLLK